MKSTWQITYISKKRIKIIFLNDRKKGFYKLKLSNIYKPMQQINWINRELI